MSTALAAFNEANRSGDPFHLVVTTRSGREYRGAVVNVTTDYVRLRPADSTDEIFIAEPVESVKIEW